MKFRTKSGSIYELSKTTMTWTRTNATELSGKIRSETGRLIDWPDVRVGERAVLVDDSVMPGFDGHAVFTTEVAEILDCDCPFTNLTENGDVSPNMWRSHEDNCVLGKKS